MGVDPAPSSQGRSWRPEAAAKPWTGKLTCQLTSVPWRPGCSAEPGEGGSRCPVRFPSGPQGVTIAAETASARSGPFQKGGLGSPEWESEQVSAPGVHWAAANALCLLEEPGGVLTRVGSPGRALNKPSLHHRAVHGGAVPAPAAQAGNLIRLEVCPGRRACPKVGSFKLPLFFF